MVCGGDEQGGEHCDHRQGHEQLEEALWSVVVAGQASYGRGIQEESLRGANGDTDASVQAKDRIRPRSRVESSQEWLG